MCQKEESDGKLRWMKCPNESPGTPSNSREFLDDLNTEDDEQKFCCGSVQDRFCCSFAEKLREVPEFDPSSHYDASMRYRFRHLDHYGFWHYMLFFVISVLFILFISYIFGCVIFEVRNFGCNFQCFTFLLDGAI